MNKNTQKEKAVLAALNECFEAYARRDMEALLAGLGSDIIQFGMSAVNTKRTGRAELKAEFEHDWSLSEAASAEIGWNSISVADSMAWLAADIIFHWKEAGAPEEALSA